MFELFIICVNFNSLALFGRLYESFCRLELFFQLCWSKKASLLPHIHALARQAFLTHNTPSTSFRAPSSLQTVVDYASFGDSTSDEACSIKFLVLPMDDVPNAIDVTIDVKNKVRF